MKININITKKYELLTIEEFLNHFYLGKQKRNQLSFILNGTKVNRNATLANKDRLEIEYEEEIDFIPQEGKLRILYEDDHLLVVDKPSGMMVHPDDKAKTGTLANLVAHYYQSKGLFCAVRYAHRIDTDTTGIVLFSKHILMTSYLSQLIETLQIEKVYRAIVSGKFQEKKGRISLPIGEHRHHNQKMRVSQTGKPALTDYEVLQVLSKNLSYLELRITTGRTHQIRVHMSHMGHPLLGDALYNGNMNLLKRQALHAYRVCFYHPFLEKEFSCTCDIPMDMKRLVEGGKL